MGNAEYSATGMASVAVLRIASLLLLLALTCHSCKCIILAVILNGIICELRLYSCIIGKLFVVLNPGKPIKSLLVKTDANTQVYVI